MADIQICKWCGKEYDWAKMLGVGFGYCSKRCEVAAKAEENGSSKSSSSSSGSSSALTKSDKQILKLFFKLLVLPIFILIWISKPASSPAAKIAKIVFGTIGIIAWLAGAKYMITPTENANSNTANTSATNTEIVQSAETEAISAKETSSTSSSVPELTREIKVTNPTRMNGKDVTRIQKRLTELGYTEVGEIDGYYGPKSESAVKRFQDDNGLPQTGIVDQITYSTLFMQ